MGFKRQNLVSFGKKGKQTVERRERERKEEEEEEEEEEGGAKIKQSQAPKRYGTTNLVYGCLDFVWITWNCKLYMLKCLSPNLGF